MRSDTIVLFSGKASNSSVNSTAIDVRQILNFSLQVVGAAGSLAGTFQLQVCNLPYTGSPDGFNTTYTPAGAQWTNLGTALTFAQSSAASSQIISKTDVTATGIRLVYTDTSGGTNTATFSAYLRVQGI